MAAFEVFTKRVASVTDRPLVTIQRRGIISLNRSAYVALGEPEAVELMCDRDEHLVGLRPAHHGSDHAYLVRSATGRISGPYVISAIAFTKFLELDRDHSLRWDAEVIDGVLCVDLDAEATPVTSNRARGRHDRLIG